ncbi:MAG: DinB family protein [Chloroflexi bacterium]|nr:DinB family protein [Chloroflexota bacterium]
MPKSPQFLAKRLRSEGEKMTEFFAGLDDAGWMKMLYTEGQDWRIRDVLAHFVSAERSFLRLFEAVLQRGEGVSDDFDVNRFNNAEVANMKEMSTAELLEAFVEIRAKMIAWVETLNTEDLQKEGRHPFLEETTLEEMIKLVYRHNQIHYRDIRKNVA